MLGVGKAERVSSIQIVSCTHVGFELYLPFQSRLTMPYPPSFTCEISFLGDGSIPLGDSFRGSTLNRLAKSRQVGVCECMCACAFAALPLLAVTFVGCLLKAFQKPDSSTLYAWWKCSHDRYRSVGFQPASSLSHIPRAHLERFHLGQLRDEEMSPGLSG